MRKNNSVPKNNISIKNLLFSLKTCQEVTTQHCIDSPIVLDEPAVSESCHVVTKVDCVPVLEQIPKTICDPVETIVPGNLTPVNPLAYHLFGR
jgi:hypothetical protein